MPRADTLDQIMPRWVALALLVGLGTACAGTHDPQPVEPATVPEPPPEASQPAAPTPAEPDHSIPSQLASDFKWAVNNLEADGEDLVTAPCHTGELLQKPEFYWTTLAGAAALGGAFALDTPVRIHTKHISHATASALESDGQIALWAATAAIYGWGIYSDDARSRRYVMTTLLGTAVAGAISVGTKAAFGRLRPNQNQGAFRFGEKNGDSFVSSVTTPAFALAAGISEWGDNRWYVALPAYGAATAVGLGRMGKDAHWLSDIVGSAIIGVGSTELLLYLHNQHDAHPSRYRVFPLVGPNGGVGIGVSGEF